MKECFKCGERKPLDRFYKHSQMADGHLGKCKECTKMDAHENREKRLEYYRAYDRERGNRQPPGYGKKYNKDYPIKYGAITLVNNYVRDGKLIRAECCESCGKQGRLHGHHDDYARPLDVRWLCGACHRRWHVKNGEGINGS